MNNQNVLVKFRKDWADEFDVHGFAVYDKGRWERDFQRLKESKSWNGFHFGTNEGWDHDDELIGDFIDGYTVIEISDKEVESLRTLFKKSYNDNIEFGVFPHPSDLVDYDEDDDIDG